MIISVIVIHKRVIKEYHSLPKKLVKETKFNEFQKQGKTEEVWLALRPKEEMKKPSVSSSVAV